MLRIGCFSLFDLWFCYKFFSLPFGCMYIFPLPSLCSNFNFVFVDFVNINYNLEGNFGLFMVFLQLFRVFETHFFVSCL